MDSLVGLVLAFGGIFVVGVISSLIEGALYRRRDRRARLLTQRSQGFPVLVRESKPADQQQSCDPASSQVPDPRL